MEIIVNPKTLNNNVPVIQLKTAVGAAMKCFEKGIGINVPRSRFLPVKKTSDLMLVMSNLYSLDHGSLVMSPQRMFPTTPLVKLGDNHFAKMSTRESEENNQEGSTRDLDSGGGEEEGGGDHTNDNEPLGAAPLVSTSDSQASALSIVLPVISEAQQIAVALDDCVRFTRRQLSAGRQYRRRSGVDESSGDEQLPVFDRFAAEDVGLPSDTESSESKPKKKKKKIIITRPKKKPPTPAVKRHLSSSGSSEEEEEEKKIQIPDRCLNSDSSDIEEESTFKDKNVKETGKGKTLLGKRKVVKKGIKQPRKKPKLTKPTISSDEESAPQQAKDSFTNYLGLHGTPSKPETKEDSDEDEITCVTEMKKSPENDRPKLRSRMKNVKNGSDTEGRVKPKLPQVKNVDSMSESSSSSAKRSVRLNNKTTAIINIESSDSECAIFSEKLSRKTELRTEEKSKREVAENRINVSNWISLSDDSSDERPSDEESESVKKKSGSDLKLSTGTKDLSSDSSDVDTTKKRKKDSDADNTIVILSEEEPVETKSSSNGPRSSGSSQDDSDSDILVVSSDPEERRTVGSEKKPSRRAGQQPAEAEAPHIVGANSTPPRRKVGAATSTPKHSTIMNEPVIQPPQLLPPTLSPQNLLPSIDNLPPSLRTMDTPPVLPLATTNKRSRKNKAPSPTEVEAKKKAVVSSVPSNKLRPLDSYYYGMVPGDAQALGQQKRGDINMKCAMCHMVIKDNLRMMRHLIGHAYNEGSYTFSDSSPQCRYCLKDFLSDFTLQSHVEETHERGSLVCLICRETNRDRTTLILHMHHNHTELELPYQCGICRFRTSQHNVLIDHFHEEHKNTDKLQCPFCLKIVSMQTVDGRKITQNQYFFIHHIQKHQRKTLARKCNKCVLWFVHKDLIKEHFRKDHTSCKDIPGVERKQVDGMEAVMMPIPLGTGVAPPKNQSTKSKNVLLNNFTVNNFKTLQIGGMEGVATCCKCEGEFLQDEHFPRFLSCLKCRFSTCCSKAMHEHCVVFHDKFQPKPQFNVGKVITLDKPLFCVCGFSSKSGNKLARHLSDCKRKSAYPSPERAAQCTLQGQSASFPPLVTLDEEEDSQDNEEKWMRAFTQPRASSDNAENTEKPEPEREKAEQKRRKIAVAAD